MDILEKIDNKLSGNLNEGDSKFRKPVEAVAKQIKSMMEQAIKMEDRASQIYDKITDKMNTDTTQTEMGQVQAELMEVVDAANELYQKTKKAWKEIDNIGSRF